MEKKSKLDIAIKVLAVLLGCSIIALVGMLAYKYVILDTKPSVIVSDNVISTENMLDSSKGDTTNQKQSDEQNSQETGENTKTDASIQTSSLAMQINSLHSNATGDNIATALSLYNRNHIDNTAFNVSNMIPGDTETKYYCVKVSYKNTVTVRFSAKVRDYYDKLAEVLKCRVVLLNTGELLHDGLMKEMPESADHTLSYATNGSEVELFYEITTYLDTSVGNEYQNTSLVADFSWWVEETDNLIPPKTGDNSNVMVWFIVAMFASSALIIPIIMKRRKEGEDE